MRQSIVSFVSCTVDPLGGHKIGWWCPELIVDREEESGGKWTIPNMTPTLITETHQCQTWTISN